ncbi:DsbA family protein [Nitrosomonas sp.]|uniref:DsbA family protein n=1 Tax=Nitrosomonas sp. TaxID=42353 RepID=UPI0025DAFC71|nr:DsbA family protein [Nitrosomonas sp.]MCC6917282.1 DsbA family protein [Nitrosomonas sp.]
MEKPVLWYIADPMCSWCWGFAPVIETIRQEYAAALTVKVLPGGLRPGTDTPLLPEKRAQILHHWYSVHAATGQSFTFENALPEGLVYDTEPACRAVVSVSLIEPDRVFLLFAAIQQAFYVRQEDVTRFAVLKKLAVDLGIPESRFAAMFQSDEAKQQTQAGFQRAAQWGISGFPALVIEHGSGRYLITAGYRPVAALCQLLDTWLQQFAD